MKILDKYVTPEQAKRLKALGFNEPVAMRYVSSDPSALPVPCLVTPVEFNALCEKWKDAGYEGAPVDSLSQRVNEDHQGETCACPTLYDACEWFQDHFGYQNGVTFGHFSERYSWNVFFGGNDSAGGMGLSSKRESYLRMLTVMIEYQEDLIQSKEHE